MTVALHYNTPHRGPFTDVPWPERSLNGRPPRSRSRVESRTRHQMALRVAARSARQLRYAPVLASTVRGVHSSPSSSGASNYSINIIDINAEPVYAASASPFPKQPLQTRHSRDMLKLQKSCTTMPRISCSAFRSCPAVLSAEG